MSSRKNKLIYIARYADDKLIEFGLAEPSHSLTRKVQGVSSALNCISQPTYILASRLRSKKFSKPFVYKQGKNIIIVPYSIPIYLGSLGNYVVGIISSAFIVRKFFKKNLKRKYLSRVVIWDLLPDSVLPVLFSVSLKKNVILDVEEFLSDDPEASQIFKIFERICLKCMKFKSVISSFNLTGNRFKLKSKIIIPGFSSIDYDEEIKYKKIRQLNIDTGDKLRIIFSGRLDATRGLKEFINIASFMEDDKRFIFVITGFGSKTVINELKNKVRKMKNVILKIDLNRNDYMNEITSCDVGFSYLDSSQFQSSSFPSKLIEYMSWLPLTISNIDFNKEMPGSIHIFDDDSHNKDYVLEMFQNIYKNIDKYKETYLARLNSKNPYSINRFAEDNKKLLEEIFYENY